MHTLIVYESYFGCTQQIAEAMAEEFRTAGATTLAGVETARHHSVAAYDLLVVGGPTQARGLSRPGTRRGVLIRGARHRRRVRVDPRMNIGLREWLDGLGLWEGSAAAAFDTRLEGPALLTGQASHRVAAELQHHGFRLVDDPASFLVDPNDRLLTGEVERASAWAEDLIRRLRSADRHRPGPATGLGTFPPRRREQ